MGAYLFNHLIYLYTYIIYPLLSSIIRVMVRIYFMGAYLFNIFIHIYHISTSIIYYQSHGQDIFSWVHIYSIYLYAYIHYYHLLSGSWSGYIFMGAYLFNLFIHIYPLLSSIIRVIVRIWGAKWTRLLGCLAKYVCISIYLYNIYMCVYINIFAC